MANLLFTTEWMQRCLDGISPDDYETLEEVQNDTHRYRPFTLCYEEVVELFDQLIKDNGEYKIRFHIYDAPTPDSVDVRITLIDKPDGELQPYVYLNDVIPYIYTRKVLYAALGDRIPCTVYVQLEMVKKTLLPD
jgi:hypothetical protein